MIHVVVTETKRRIVEDYLTYEGAPLADRMRVHTWEGLAAARSLVPGTWVLADLDALGSVGLEVARLVRAALEEAGLRVLNHPDRTLRRLDLLRALHREGINDYRAFHVEELVGGTAGAGTTGGSLDPTELRYPVFVRGASDHFGPLSGALDSPRELGAFLGRAGAAGLEPDDLIVVEIRDTARADGRYTKYGAFVVGERIHLQHFMLGRSWMIKHRQSDFTVAIAEEEHRYVRADAHCEALAEVVRVSGAEYGRIDFAVDAEGRIQVWEINLCPIVGRSRASPKPFSPPEVRPLRQRTKDVFNPRLVAAWEAVDSDPGWGPAHLDVPEPLAAAFREERGQPAGGAGLLRLLQAKRHFGERW